MTAGLCLYRDGRDSVAWHGDTIGRGSTQDTMVAILSLGTPRPLLLRPVGGGSALRHDVGHGDLLVMGGSCQRTWQHAIPKSAQADRSADQRSVPPARRPVVSPPARAPGAPGAHSRLATRQGWPARATGKVADMAAQDEDKLAPPPRAATPAEAAGMSIPLAPDAGTRASGQAGWTGRLRRHHRSRLLPTTPSCPTARSRP